MNPAELHDLKIELSSLADGMLDGLFPDEYPVEVDAIERMRKLLDVIEAN